MGSEMCIRDSRIGPGSVVWVRRREWFPGRVVDMHELPAATKRYLPNPPVTEWIVQLYPPYNEVVIVKRERVGLLGENKDDKRKASRNDVVHRAYMYALSCRNGDI